MLPIYNEEGSLDKLFERLFEVLDRGGESFEIIAVDDGSRDKSVSCLVRHASARKELKVVCFQFNSGQTAALAAGIQYASGDVIVTMDSDLQNDPDDIPRLIEKLNEGYDVVSGWRKERWKKNVLTRKFPSVTANWIISKVTGVKLNDYGCTLKAYKRDILSEVRLYGEMHRFVPAYAAWQGARIAELPVQYAERIAGTSKYGMSRIFSVLLDLVVIRFLDKYMDRPMHFFGRVGFLGLFLGITAGLTAVILKIFGIRNFVATPLPLFSAMLIIVGVQLVIMGVLAEILMRTYYESQNKKPYRVKHKINFGSDS